MWVALPVLGWASLGLAETGLVGRTAFLLVFWRLMQLTKKIYKETPDPFFKGTSLGFYAGIWAM